MYRETQDGRWDAGRGERGKARLIPTQDAATAPPNNIRPIVVV
jgi:hypothetical protein